MALLAAYLLNKAEGESLEDYLNAHVFANVSGTTVDPDPVDVEGFCSYLKQYCGLLAVERAAVENI